MTRTKQKKITYTREFREAAVKLALAAEKTVADIARELELPERKLYSWVQAWEKKNAVIEQESSIAAEERIKQLEKRTKMLEQENEILKKAAAYFAKPSLQSTPSSNAMKESSQLK